MADLTHSFQFALILLSGFLARGMLIVSMVHERAIGLTIEAPESIAR
jgi:hypothetical protein